MADPFVFLTSTSDSVPSGRNARAAARASTVRHTTRPASARGTFNVFSATPSHKRKETRQRSNPLESPAGQQSQRSSQRALSTEQHVGNVPRMIGPQSITIEELLGTATARIRHDLALTLKEQPSQVRDLLRCRQWAVADFASGTLLLTPEVHSAVKYLEHKVLTTQPSEQPSEVGLQKYGVALSELQHSVQDPQRRMQPSVLAASHILAICEMLGDTTKGKYLNFVGGIVALSRLQVRKGGDFRAQLQLCSNASAILVEAIIAKRSDAILDQPWSHTLTSAGDQGFLSPEDAVSSADGANLIFSLPSVTHTPLASGITDEDRTLLISRARGLHSTLKQSIQSSLLPSSRPKYACPIFGTISSQITVMLGLDDFISQITAGGENASASVQSDNYGFYADIICNIDENLLKI